MKKIKINVSQTGTDDFIAQSDVKITVDGKFVKNKVYEIVKNAIELNFKCKIEKYTNSQLKVTTLNGNNKFFKFYYLDDMGFDVKNKNEKEVKERLKNISDFIKNIESWILEVHKITKNYTLELE